MAELRALLLVNADDGAPDGGGEGGGGCAHVVHAPGGPLPSHEFPDCLQYFVTQAVANRNMYSELDSLFVFQPVMSMSK